ICSSYLPDSKDASFEIFRKSAEYYLDSIHQARELYYVDTLVMWSLVHGIALLISKKSIVYDGDYMELVDKMLNEKIV
ncbi:MAG: hypothetical protein Q8930_10530, partial [Bacillota bacterium]|nr:hypothetical protein [Bacillota bacterium]